ncbi:hypothetical protein WICMUC_004939 [Wickerhamomyces mucosus]|uniref:Mediator of RNA polymerase II transcription subunit 12 n=1 Tax=Wickerhamomyces mucosus TaxID=1378264 RepID=A0A9P8PEC2_9ASCO|nr:hypothetical protein WICMUC_004939 [Wickerhamomyces mucosus]
MHNISQRIPPNRRPIGSSVTTSIPITTSSTTTTTTTTALNSNNNKDDLPSNRYLLTHPQGVYSLDPMGQPLKYPDFQPWFHNSLDEDIAISHLQKGFFEPAIVSNEFVSARNIMHNLLQSKNSLDQLSNNLQKAIDVRSQNNTLGQSNFKPPPRVTLTDQKREIWLKELANSSIPLRKLSRTIPHGIRNKILIEQCVIKNIPINRAIWLVRCVSINELRTLKRKPLTNSQQNVIHSTQSNFNSNLTIIEINWIQEWTQQVLEYIEKLSSDYLRFETFLKAKESWRLKINYILKFLSNLYMENLIDSEILGKWILNFIKICKIWELPLGLTIINLFWNKFIINNQFIIKELTELLILKHWKINHELKNLLDNKESIINDYKLNESIKSKLLINLEKLINFSFIQSSDNFIIPNHWNQLKSTIIKILDLSNPLIAKNFELIAYRNESLMINYSIYDDNNINTAGDLNNKDSIDNNDLITILDSIDQSPFNPIRLNDYLDKFDWKSQLINLINWGITKYRFDNYRIYLIVEILKKIKSKEIEQDLLNFIFQIPNDHKSLSQLNQSNLIFLINELISIKLFKIGTYIRRLISSGLIYLQKNNYERQYHIEILTNIRTERLNSNELSMILKKLTNDNSLNILNSITENYNHAITIIENNDMVQNFEFLNNLSIGLRLKISSKILSDFKSITNQLNYQSFEKYLQIFIILQDFKSLHIFINHYLTTNSLLTIDQLDLISKVLISYNKIFIILPGFDKLIYNFITKFQRSNDGSINFLEFWKLIYNFFQSNPDHIDLKNQLELLIKDPINNLKISDLEINEMINNCGNNDLPLDFKDFNQSINNNNFNNKFHNNFQILIRIVFSAIDEVQLSSSLKLLKLLKISNESEFNKILYIHLKKNYTNGNQLEIFNYNLLFHLISEELISIEKIFEIFMNFNNFNSNNHTNKNAIKPQHSSNNNQFLMDLIFKYHNGGFNAFKLNLIKEKFKLTNQETILKFIRLNIIDDKPSVDQPTSSTELLFHTFLEEGNRQYNNNYKPECITSFLNQLVHSPSTVVKYLGNNDKQFIDKLIPILNNEISLDESDNDDTTNDDVNNNRNNFKKLVSNFQKFDRFSLFIFQLLFKLIIKDDSSEFNEIMENLILVNNCNGIIIGSLFQLLSPDLKVKLIHHLESVFLHSAEFPIIKFNRDDQEQVSIITICEIIIRLSQGLSSIPLPDNLVFSLDNSLETLLKLVNNTSNFTNSPEVLLESISLFLKIIIIHKSFLIDIIIERNSIRENFLNNLVNLLNTKLLAKNLKLKNILYDLISSLKSSINGTNQSIKLPLSVINLPVISSTTTTNTEISNGSILSSLSTSPTLKKFSLQHRLYNNNLHDSSNISNLYIWNGTQGFNELNLKPFDMLEDSNPTENINDTAISLQLFDASIERKNPT